jgi:uridine phosphorylase
MEDIPLLEFDEDPAALIEPAMMYEKSVLPERCVLLFYGALIDSLKKSGKVEKIYQLSTTAASLISMDVCQVVVDGTPVAVVFPGLGAPFSAAMLDELIALGCRKFVACGSCGVLKPELKRGAIVIPQSAVRDEGTSFHYCAPARTIEMAPGVVTKLESVLKRHHIPYEIGKTWTTDAFYRETKRKVARRKAEGCVTVEMECSALLAVARFRDVIFGQYLGAGDDVSGDEWDPRRVNDRMPFQEKIFWLSVEACLSL